MTEEQLQSAAALAFSERWPLKTGQFFHVSNERNNPLQAYKARALGIIPGVSDFIFFSKKFNVGIEIKTPGSRHKISTIKNQIKWGKLWESKGNTWRLCTTVEEIMSCCEGKFKGMTIKQVEKKINSVTTKTIKF